MSVKATRITSFLKKQTRNRQLFSIPKRSRSRPKTDIWAKYRSRSRTMSKNSIPLGSIVDVRGQNTSIILSQIGALMSQQDSKSISLLIYFGSSRISRYRQCNLATLATALSMLIWERNIYFLRLKADEKSNDSSCCLVFPRESHFVIPGKAGMQTPFPGNSWGGIHQIVLQ
jgi:hypothetical protein